MRGLSKAMENWMVAGVIALTLASTSQLRGSTALLAGTSDNGGQSFEPPKQDGRTDSAKENSQPIQSSPSTSTGQSLSQPSQKSGHTVTLRWAASAPATKALGDAVKQYRLCRSTRPNVVCKGNAENTIGWVPASDTSYVDTHVQSGQIYYYVTTAISMGGVESESSNEVRVQVP